MSATTAVVEVLMPRLSDSMEEGTITAWHKASGDDVSHGDEIVDIETDKAVMTYEAEASGVLEIVAGEGTTVKLGGVIGRLLPPRAKPPATSNGRQEPPERGPGPAAQRQPSAARPTPAQPLGNGVPSGGRVNASPVARRVAADLSVDLVDVTGSGPNGRVVKRDVLAAARPTADADHLARMTQGTRAAAPTDAPASTDQTSTRQISRVQQTIARRMALAKSTQPEFTLESTVDMTDAVALREQIKRSVSSDLPSLNDLIIKASALALREHPVANGSFVDESFELHARINIGIAVATQDALIVPVIKDADEKSVGQIARESRRLAARVRDGDVTASDLSGGTFTISNLGMFGIDRFTAILNPPQAAILAVGAVNAQPAFRSGEVVGRKLMALTLTCDHRILYGATAAEFLREVRALLEDPWGLLL
jgi:pyruvate dehydrogenase E2 component (dihydrolipoyllysine-residue acetyltransferase)